jgi:hypothetical protein
LSLNASLRLLELRGQVELRVKALHLLWSVPPPTALLVVVFILVGIINCGVLIPTNASGFKFPGWKPELRQERAAVAVASLPCWRDRLGSLDLCSATGSQRWGYMDAWSQAAAPNGVGTSRRWPWSLVQFRWSYGAGSWHCFVLGGGSGAAWAARSPTRLVHLWAIRRLS